MCSYPCQLTRSDWAQQMSGHVAMCGPLQIEWHQRFSHILTADKPTFCPQITLSCS